MSYDTFFCYEIILMFLKDFSNLINYSKAHYMDYVANSILIYLVVLVFLVFLFFLNFQYKDVFIYVN